MRCVQNDQGKWSAKMYTVDDMISHKINTNISTLVNLVKRVSGDMYWERNRAMNIEDHDIKDSVLMNIMSDYSYQVNRFKKECIKNLTKQIKKIK